jgi:hypothetical protein
MGELSLALYECLSACKSKGRNSAASGTNVSFHLPISVNATVSISSVFRYYIPFACIDPSFGPYHIIVISYFLSRKLMFHSGAANLPTDSGASVVPVSRRYSRRLAATRLTTEIASASSPLSSSMLRKEVSL